LGSCFAAVGGLATRAFLAPLQVGTGPLASAIDCGSGPGLAEVDCGLLTRAAADRSSGWSVDSGLQLAASSAADSSTPLTGLDASLEPLTGAFFGASLFPYLYFLFLLNQEEVKTPKGVFNGFAFLLVFVFGSIPAAIYCQVTYGVSYANVDTVHGLCESLLTVTNLILTLGLREALRQLPGSTAPCSPTDDFRRVATSAGALLLAAVFVLSLPTWFGAAHPEPANALSLPTWVIHCSSIIEWLYAQDLLWEYGRRSGNLGWKRLSLGMVPLHTSGLCACTFHLFYNAEPLGGLALIQAALTCLGNSTLAWAACSLASGASSATTTPTTTTITPTTATIATTTTSVPLQLGLETDLVIEPYELGSDAAFLAKLAFISLAVSVLVKYGEVFVDLPFQPSYPLALAIVAVPTLFNCVKWGRALAAAPAA
ncbi:unnamed protein product, partial [Polarella glacialis]